jgi:hypothetical protein
MCATRWLGSLLILLVAAAPSLAQSRPDPGKAKTIRRVLEAQGMQKMMRQVATHMVATLKTAHPDVPDEIWDRFEQKLSSQEWVDQFIPIYDKYYSQEDLEGLLAFYESPLGQKVVKTMPLLMLESMQIGQAWGIQEAQELLKEIREYESKQEKESASSR